MSSNSYAQTEGGGDAGRETVSTRVQPETRDRVDNRCGNVGESRAAFIRRLIHLYLASVDGRLKCDHCGEPVRLESW